MSASRFSLLPQRDLIRVSGEDARHFLQNLVTCDISGLKAREAAFGALLTPQGKIQFDFLILGESDNSFLLDVASSVIPDLLKRLTFYKLRAKVTLTGVSEGLAVAAMWQTEELPDVPETLLVARDPRLASLGWRVVGPAHDLAEVLAKAGSIEVGIQDWQIWRIGYGIPEGGVDFAFGDAFPHDVDMDQIGGVSFKKGCYIGQEVVSRMEHRGTARRRAIKISANGPLPEVGTPILADGKSVGTLGSSANQDGLALVRLDKVKAALDNDVELTCGETRLTPILPDWARFGWPESAATTSD